MNILSGPVDFYLIIGRVIYHQNISGGLIGMLEDKKSMAAFPSNSYHLECIKWDPPSRVVKSSAIACFDNFSFQNKI